MQITIDTSQELSAQDREILALLVGTEAPKAAKKAPKAEKPAPAPEPDPDATAPSLTDAVSTATKLVSAGQSAKVKAALADAGVARVSELSEDAIPAFLAALNG